MLAQLVAEVFQVFRLQPAFQKRPRIDARGRVPLEVNAIAGLIAIARVEEMVEAHFEQRG